MAMLRDSYLDEWRDYGTSDRLKEAFGLAGEIKTLYDAIGDARWLRAIQDALHWQPPPRSSADAWTLDRRQYYFAKTLRRLM